MTVYSDVPQVNVLYQQRENVTSCIAALDDGGQVSTISVVPPPGQMMMVMLSPVNVPQPTPPAILANTREILVQMQADIDAQLADLGVQETPPPAEETPPEPSPGGRA